MNKDNISKDTPITDTFRQYIKDTGGTFTHGCCKVCLDDMDKAPDGEITNSMTSQHPSGLYYSQPSPCVGCASEETEQDCAMCPENL